MPRYELKKLSAETKSAFAQLFVINFEAIQQFGTGEYFVLYAEGSKRVRNILGIEREILIAATSTPISRRDQFSSRGALSGKLTDDWKPRFASSSIRTRVGTQN